MSGPNKQKKALIKGLIMQLHQGLPVEEAKNRFEREIGSISSSEIAEIEQSLINEGMAVEEIKKFCNVHALLFEAALQEGTEREENPAHPVTLFKLENREIEKVTQQLKEAATKNTGENWQGQQKQLKTLLEKLSGVDLHYTHKEQLLFPRMQTVLVPL